MASYIRKTAAEIEDFTIDWSTRGLGTDRIVGSAWRVSPSGLTLDHLPAGYTKTTTTVWLSGGTAGTNYTVTNTVATSGGRTFEERFYCSVTE